MPVFCVFYGRIFGSSVPLRHKEAWSFRGPNSEVRRGLPRRIEVVGRLGALRPIASAVSAFPVHITNGRAAGVILYATPLDEGLISTTRLSVVEGPSSQASALEMTFLGLEKP